MARQGSGYADFVVGDLSPTFSGDSNPVDLRHRMSWDHGIAIVRHALSLPSDALDESRDVVVALDNDGVLFPVQHDPAKAVPASGAIESVIALRDAGARVEIVTGREAAFISEHYLGSGIVIHTLAGLQHCVDGEVTDTALLTELRPALEAIQAEIHAKFDRNPRYAAVKLEDKGPIVTIHYHGAPHLRAEIKEFCDEITERYAHTGIRFNEEVMGFDVHPTDKISKRTVVEQLTSDARVAMGLGDGVIDLGALQHIKDFHGSELDPRHESFLFGEKAVNKKIFGRELQTDRRIGLSGTVLRNGSRPEVVAAGNMRPLRSPDEVVRVLEAMARDLSRR